jgi:hypothetical protein
MRPTVIIDIDPKGTPRITVEGVSGPGCHSVIQDLLNDLGETVSVERTPEYYQRQAAQSHVRHHG